MKAYLFGAVSVLSLIAAGSASAHDDEGWYLRGNAGYGIHSDIDISDGIDSSQHGNGLQSEGDVAYSLGGGYDFGDHWRLEADYDNLSTSFGSISQTPNSSASVLTESIMLNALYDFDGFGKWEPYVGAGAGIIDGKVNAISTDIFGENGGLIPNPTCVGDRVANPQGLTCAISDSDRGFGWQLLAGLGYDITDNLTWDTHYTYQNGPELDLVGHVANISTGVSEAITADVDGLQSHTVMTGLRYTFGHSHAAPIALPVEAPTPSFLCWDGATVFNAGQCPPKPEPVVEVIPEPTVYSCWDGSATYDLATCPAEPAPVVQAPTYTCWDGTVTYDLGTCAPQPAPQPNLNLCGESSVAIFNVPVNTTPKQMSRLGTVPEFGDSHGLTPDQFFNKLNARYNSSATDKAYLNYLFKSMGYSNGWADAQSYMFSEEVLPVGTRGMLGLGEQHHYAYSILPSNQRDREAFRIQSANGSVVHFMKTCGNYMYACE